MKRIPFLYLFFLLLSCNRDTILEQGTVRGTVRDKITNEGVSGATVYLLSHVPSGGFGGGGGSTQIDFTTSNSDGSFSFQLDYDSELAYTCAATHDLYFDYGDEFPVLEEIKVVENVEVNIQPKAWLNLHVKNVNEYGVSDHIDIQSGSIDPLYGNNVDSTFILTVNGNALYNIVWYIYISGFNDGSLSDDIYCPSFDTTYYEILY